VRDFIDAVKADAMVDSTGSHSALRAGFIFCPTQGLDGVEAARLGTLVAARSIASEAPQGWSINPEDLN